MTILKTCAFLIPLAAVTAQPLMAEPVPAQAGPAPTVAAAIQDTNTLKADFQDPPASARPRVWWHWMNGNVTKDGIAKDLAWMKRIGIGGLQNFDANVQTPQIVDERLDYMSAQWKDAFRFAAREADRLDLELAIASSPGWTQTGGPWVAPEDAMKKLAWSETVVTGGQRFSGTLNQPPVTSGLYQDMKADPLHGLPLANPEDLPPIPSLYVDAVVLAVPAGDDESAAQPTYHDTAGNILSGSVLVDADVESYLDIPRPAEGVPALNITYDKAQTLRSATLYMPGAGSMHFGGTVAPRLEANDDGQTWRAIADIPVKLVPSTIAFAPVTARHFRIMFNAPEMAGFDIAPPPAGVDFSAAGGLASAAFGPPALHVGLLKLSSRDRVNHAEAKAGFSIFSDYSTISDDVPSTPGIPLSKVVDLTGRMKPDGTLDWQAPPGKWRILRMGYSLIGKVNHPASPEATGLEVDKLDADAVRRYLDHYIGMYQDAAGPELVGARGVRGLLTDSIEVGPANWTPKIVEKFTELRGYDPTPWLPALTGLIMQSRGDTDKFLYDFRRTLADLLASEHYGTIAAVAHDHGLTVYGEALEAGRSSLGDDMAMRSYTDVPMAAIWVFPKNGSPSHSARADIRGAASVAHIYGQNIVAAESMTSFLSPWAFGPGDLKRIIDAAFVEGVNRPIIHTSAHAPVDDKLPGLSLGVFGQYFNRHEAWAELAKPWLDYLARNSFMLQQGRNVADIAYFYGEEAPLAGLFSEKAITAAPKSVAFDFINADALTGLLTNDGQEMVTPGGARYRALFLGGSSQMMTLPTLRKLATLVQNGATVIGPRPQDNPSLTGTRKELTELTAKLWSGERITKFGKGQVIASPDIESALADAGIDPDFHFTGSDDTDIPFVHRKLADGDSYFLVNRRNRPETIEARFRVTGKRPELWDAKTGQSEPVSYRTDGEETVIAMTLAPEQSVHVVFRAPAAADSQMFKKAVPVEIGRVNGPWQVSFEAGRGAPAEATFAQLKPLDEHAETGIKYFSGIATYENSFATPAQWQPGQQLWLDLGEVKEVAEISVNGKRAGHAWHAPNRIDISAFAKPGNNTLSIRVANLWVNRMIGDVQPDAQKISWTAAPTYRPEAPLRRSGLIGPVTIWGDISD